MTHDLSMNIFENYTQQENQFTKALIMLFKFSEKDLLRRFLKRVGIKNSGLGEDVSFRIQKKPDKYSTEDSESKVIKKEKKSSKTIPDAWIMWENNAILIETKIGSGCLYKEQILGHLDRLKEIKFKNKYLLTITNTSQESSILNEFKIKTKARKYGIKIVPISWRKEITEFFLSEYNKVDERKKQYFLLEEFINYLGGYKMIGFPGFKKSDFEIFETENKDKRVNEMKRIIRPKLKVFKDYLNKEFEAAGLPLKGKISRPEWRSAATHIWINFSAERKDISTTVHYSLVIDEKGVYFQIHLYRENKNANNFLEEVKKKGVKDFAKLLRNLAKQDNSFELVIEGNEEDDSWTMSIDKSIDEELLEALITVFDKEGHYLQIYRWFSPDMKSDFSKLKDGNKLMEYCAWYIEPMKPIYEYLHKFVNKR